MNSWQSIFNNLSISLDLFSGIGMISGALITLYVCRKELLNPFARERHEKLIYPLFNLLEPYLYQKTVPDIFDKALQLINDNKLFADGELLSIYYFCSQEPSSIDNYLKLCRYIDKAFDKSCRKIGIKRRKISYRLHREQYRSRFHFALYMARDISVGILIYLLGSFLILSIGATYIYLFINASQPSHFVALALFLLVLFMFLRSSFD